MIKCQTCEGFIAEDNTESFVLSSSIGRTARCKCQTFPEIKETLRPCAWSLENDSEWTALNGTNVKPEYGDWWFSANRPYPIDQPVLGAKGKNLTLTGDIVKRHKDWDSFEFTVRRTLSAEWILLSKEVDQKTVYEWVDFTKDLYPSHDFPAYAWRK